MPHAYYKYFLDSLLDTVREGIAECSEVSTDKILWPNPLRMDLLTWVVRSIFFLLKVLSPTRVASHEVVEISKNRFSGNVRIVQSFRWSPASEHDWHNFEMSMQSPKTYFPFMERCCLLWLDDG